MSDLQRTAAGMAVNTAPGVQAQEPGPDTRSGDYNRMAGLWAKVSTMAGGVDAMRAACKTYLPRLELESDEDYKTRTATSPFTNVYADIVGSLASKPFSREVQFENPDEVDSKFKDLYDDIDGQGNNLHVFAEHTFAEGLENGIEWVLVDFTKLPPLPEGSKGRSQAEEVRLGARPYWVHICGSRVLAVYSATVRGKEILTHLRINEPTLVRTKYSEVIKERVRIFDRQEFVNKDGQPDYLPAKWSVEEKSIDERGKVVWTVIEQGAVPIKVIPMVPFRTGKRIGNGWAVKAPLANLIDLQLDAYQQESNLRNIEMLTCYPMLTASGVEPPASADPSQQAGPSTAGRLMVGPRAVLYAPPQPGGGQPGNWSFIEPSAESVKVLSGELDKTWGNMREIGMQPLAESNITVITSANVSVKAKSALQAFALRLKDALEQAFEVTALWLNADPETAPGVDVYKDFGVDLQSGQEMTTLQTMAKDGQLSNETLRAEAKRRNVLADSFDENEEKLRLAGEAVASADNQEFDPVTGEPLEPEPQETGLEGVDPSGFETADDIDDQTLAALGLAGGNE